MYRCEATSLSEFVWHLAVNYISRGYWFYVRGRIPEEKDPARTDVKIIEQYGIGISKWARARRKRRGEAGIQYIRYGRDFVILSTHGNHCFFQDEAKEIQDIRRHPLKVCGYSIGYGRGQGGWHTSVRIERQRYLCIRDYFLTHAVHRSAEALDRAFGSLGFEPYAPVRQQLFGILLAVNQARKAAGLEPVAPWTLRLRRRAIRVFTAGVADGEGVGLRNIEFVISQKPPTSFPSVNS